MIFGNELCKYYRDLHGANWSGWDRRHRNAPGGGGRGGGSTNDALRSTSLRHVSGRPYYHMALRLPLLGFGNRIVT